jgi:hypothetical protein
METELPHQGNTCEGKGMKMPKSLLEDLKPCDLFLSRLKSAFKRMEDRLRC